MEGMGEPPESGARGSGQVQEDSINKIILKSPSFYS
jgi:hypothetical protein